MDYPIKTPAQLRSLLLGFRKSSGLTQAEMANRLGVTQQSYARLEAKPESASMERLLKVLRLLDVEITLVPAPDSVSNDKNMTTHTPATKREEW